jgi:hypothetical protein
MNALLARGEYTMHVPYTATRMHEKYEMLAKKAVSF